MLSLHDLHKKELLFGVLNEGIFSFILLLPSF